MPPSEVFHCCASALAELLLAVAAHRHVRSAQRQQAGPDQVQMHACSLLHSQPRCAPLRLWFCILLCKTTDRARPRDERSCPCAACDSFKRQNRQPLPYMVGRIKAAAAGRSSSLPPSGRFWPSREHGGHGANQCQRQCHFKERKERHSSKNPCNFWDVRSDRGRLGAKLGSSEIFRSQSFRGQNATASVTGASQHAAVQELSCGASWSRTIYPGAFFDKQRSRSRLWRCG